MARFIGALRCASLSGRSVAGRPSRRAVASARGRVAWLVVLSLPGLFVAALGTTDVLTPAKDPLDSTQWSNMVTTLLGDAKVVFDDRVRVIAPVSAEDALEVPVFVDASALDGVTEMRVFADLNPIPKVLDYFPRAGTRATIGFRFKVQQSTPIRAAVRTGDGIWRVGGVWLEAAGGGCTLPSFASGDEVWAARLGETRAATWPREHGQRLRFSVMHPMDTGLAPGVPVFHITDIHVATESGEDLAHLKPFEPVSENPVFSLDLGQTGAVTLRGRDNNGNRFSARVTSNEAGR